MTKVNGMDGGFVSRGTHLSVVAYEPWHLREISLQPHQEHLADGLKNGWAENVAKSGRCWTALVSGQPVACGGFQECWEGRAAVWAILSDQAGPWMLQITRAVRKALDAHPAERIEAHALVGFNPAARWLELLGFEPETILRKFHQGRDYQSFVRLRTTL